MPKSKKTKKVTRPVKSQTSSPSEDTRTIITIILLLFIYPIGLLVMFFWTKWPVWLKIVLTIPFILVLLFSAALISLIATVVKSAPPVQQSGYNQVIEYQMPSQESTPSNTYSY